MITGTTPCAIEIDRETGQIIGAARAETTDEDVRRLLEALTKQAQEIALTA